ncbi:MAG TPA: hypothetical protein VF739_10780 [Ktedonobacterales bacterium]
MRRASPVLVTVLVLAGFGIAFASRPGVGPTRQIAASAATATDSPAALASQTPSSVATTTATTATTASATVSLAPTATKPASGANGPAPTATPQKWTTFFTLESATVVADPADNFQHTCSALVYESFILNMVAAPDGPGQTVTYSWFDDMQIQHSGSVTFAPGDTTKSATFRVAFIAGLGDGSPRQDTVDVGYPDEGNNGSWVSVKHATVAFTCVRQVTNLTFVPSISAWNAPCSASVSVTMKWTVTATPGPSAFVDFAAPTESPLHFSTWLALNPFQAQLNATTTNDPGTQASGEFTVGLAAQIPNGTYWLQVATTSPEALTARATVVKTC